jgi:hypothetical protein
MNRRSSDSIAHNRLLQEMHDQAGDSVRVRVQCKYNGSWGEYDGIISYQPTGYKANYKVEFDGEDGAYIKCPLVSGLEGRKIQGIVEIKQDQEEEEEEEPDAMDQEGEEEEAIDPEEEDEEEEEEDAIDEEDDQGDKIGEFWSEINYKEGKYTVRVVGLVDDGNYWVQQWQPKKLEFKGGRWSKPASCIKVKK